MTNNIHRNENATICLYILIILQNKNNFYCKTWVLNKDSFVSQATFENNCTVATHPIFLLQLEIIDACVNYIEALQEQLNIRNTQDPQCNLIYNRDSMSTITSLMNAITDQNVESDGRNVHVDEGDKDYLTSESSDDDQYEDELGQDNNNNKETVDAKKNHESSATTVDTESIVTSNVKMTH